MKPPVHDQLILDLSRHIVSEVAPQELPLFRPIGEAFLQNPHRPPQDHKSGDEMLGFGVGEPTVLLTVVILPVMGSVVKYLATEVTTSLKDQSSDAINETIKNLFKPFRTAGQEQETLPPPLSREQLQQVHQLAAEKARQFDLPEAQARLLADAITGSLALKT